jgi:hypothetical protein
MQEGGRRPYSARQVRGRMSCSTPNFSSREHDNGAVGAREGIVDSAVLRALLQA